MLNAKAVAWTAYLDAHAVLLPDFTKRVRSLKTCYRVAQVGFLILLADSHVIAHAADNTAIAAPPVHLATFVIFGLLGWLGLKAACMIHTAWLYANWGYSASSLQRIYKSYIGNVLPSGTLICINCRNDVHKQGEGSSRKPIKYYRVQRGSCTCPSCGFKLWPKCTRLSALFQNLDSRL